MKKVLLAFLGLIAAIGVKAQMPDTTGHYRLVWADEFNTDGAVNSRDWKFEQGFVRNNELQWYQPQNAYCQNGSLIIEARKTNLPNPGYDAQSTSWKKSRPFIEYTSASINTSGLRSFQYGRFIMRGRIDVDAGLWPAFWTLGVNGEWPSNGEIDIMEYYKGNILANIARGTSARYKAKWFSTSTALTTFNDKKWAEKFHIWRMDWDENSISLYVDDQLLNKVSLSELENSTGEHVNPFKQPHYILLNLALGGDNGGDPQKTQFPKKFEIDYVRVYQIKH